MSITKTPGYEIKDRFVKPTRGGHAKAFFTPEKLASCNFHFEADGFLKISHPPIKRLKAPMVEEPLDFIPSPATSKKVQLLTTKPSSLVVGASTVSSCAMDCLVKRELPIKGPMSKYKSEFYMPQDYGLYPLPKDLIFNNLFGPDEKSGVIFFYSNERGRSKTYEILKSQPHIDNGALVGFSTVFNLDIIALRNPKVAFICDLSGEVFNYDRMIQEAALEATDRFKFVEILLQKLALRGHLGKEKYHGYVTRDMKMASLVSLPYLEKYYKSELKRENSWLSSDEGYQIVRNLFLSRNVHFLPLNATDMDGNFMILSKWLKNHGYQLDTLYLSDVHKWIHKPERKLIFDSNIDLLVAKDTITIDANDIEDDDGTINLYQNCYLGGATPKYYEDADRDV